MSAETPDTSVDPTLFETITGVRETTEEQLPERTHYDEDVGTRIDLDDGLEEALEGQESGRGGQML